MVPWLGVTGSIKKIQVHTLPFRIEHLADQARTFHHLGLSGIGSTFGSLLG